MNDEGVKKFCVGLCMIVLSLSLFSCSMGAGQGASDGETGIVDSSIHLELNRQVSGKISKQGEVDNYYFRAVEANNILKIKCTSNTLRPSVDLLVTAYRLDKNGKKVIIYADHAPENSVSPADITMNIFIDRPQDIILSVRDLNDDEFSDNSYYLSVDFGKKPEANDTFSGADELIVNAPDSCRTDTVGFIGDVDVFTFNAPSPGIYDISTSFSQMHGSSDVDLSVDVYDNQGLLVTGLAEKHLSSYSLRPYLTGGKYYVLIDDYGKDDFDTASPFKVCVNTVDSDEQFENDGPQNAAVPADLSSISGSLDYQGDEDWYRVPVSANTATPVIYLQFNEVESSGLNYLLKFVGPDGKNVLMSHIYRGINGGYSARIKAPPGGNYLVIQQSGGENLTKKAPYRVSVQVITDADAGESIGNSLNDPVEVASGVPVTGKISYRGDEDWYAISVDTSIPQVLELSFNAGVSEAEYDIHIIRDGLEKRIFDANGGDGDTFLSTSLLVPASPEPGVVSYYIKIADYQGDSGDDVLYTLKASLVPMPVSLGDSNAIYYDEGYEVANSDGKIDLIINALDQKKFDVNNSLLDPLDSPAGIVVTQSEESVGDSVVSLTTLEFPWIGGFIDYQGDQDWFMFPNRPLNEGDLNWYYDIKIEMRTDAPGSQVEYVWRFYPDRNKNRRVMLGYSGSRDDGMIASGGDTSTDVEPLNITVPDLSRNPREKFWVGDRWKGDTFISMSDFNYIDSLSPPDDDWGYDVPYYFKLTLVYHKGISYPGDTSVQ